MIDRLHRFGPAATAVSASRIVPFPLDRRLRKIAAVARNLELRKTEDGKLRYWNRIVSDLAHEFCRNGVDDGEVHRQLTRFHDAVRHELTRAAGETPRGRNER